MINLLPPEEKAQLFFEKIKRLVMILGITIIIPVVCFVLVLLSIRFYILAQINSEKFVLEQARKEYQTPNFLMFKGLIQKNNKSLISLKNFYNKEVYISQALAALSSFSRPKNLYFTNMALNRDGSGNITVLASGFSKTREDLLAFQKSINENREVKNINFSPESWVSPQNVNFNVTFDIVR